MSLIYLNGQLVPKEEAKVSVYDHGLLYGDGVFEGIRIYNGKVFRHQEHIDRLYESAKHIWLDIPIRPDQMLAAVEETVQANQKQNGYIRLIVTRGPGNLGLDPRKCVPNVIVIVDDISLYPPELYENGMEIVTASLIRNHPNATNPRIKSLNYLNNILAKIEAIRAGCLEALMLNHKGEVAECTGDNIFIMRQGILRTPPKDAGILAGITRDVVIELATKAGIPVREETMTRHDIYIADECFLTGTAAEVIGVTKCDGRVIGSGKSGPVTKQLRELYLALTKE
ncbi:MAG: branched-chain-amino-acid transaminase [Zavarzinella sp.]